MLLVIPFFFYVYLQPPMLPPNIYVVWCGGYEDCVNVSPQHISTHHLLLTPFWSLRILATVGDNCSQVVSHIPGFTSPGDRRSIENMWGHLLLMLLQTQSALVEVYRYFYCNISKLTV